MGEIRKEMIINLYLLKLFIYFFQPQKKFKISVSKCNEIEQALATVTTRWSLANPYLMNLSGILHWHFWLVACLNDLVYSNTNSRQPCYIYLCLWSLLESLPTRLTLSFVRLLYMMPHLCKPRWIFLLYYSPLSINTYEI